MVSLKSALGLLHLFGEPWRYAFLASLMLAQIGEFSFVLGAVAIDHKIIESETHRLIVAITVLSLIVSPLWLNTMHRLQHRATDKIHSLGPLLHFVYYREWHFINEVGRNTMIRIKVILRKLRHLWIKISDQSFKRTKDYDKG